MMPQNWGSRPPDQKNSFPTVEFWGWNAGFGQFNPILWNRLYLTQTLHLPFSVMTSASKAVQCSRILNFYWTPAEQKAFLQSPGGYKLSVHFYYSEGTKF